MNKICTSIEQSKKLIELGIDVNTADMFWLTTDKPRLHVLVENLEKYSRWDCMPAWSLSALLELIPTSIDEYTEDFSQLELTKCSVSYVYANGNLRKGFLKDNFFDAAFEMIVWLKENNKL